MRETIEELYETSIHFEANLIFVDLNKNDQNSIHSLVENCTHVFNNYWIFEGDTFALPVDFDFIDSGIIPSLGSLEKSQLIEICKYAFSFDVVEGEK